MRGCGKTIMQTDMYLHVLGRLEQAELKNKWLAHKLWSYANVDYKMTYEQFMRDVDSDWDEEVEKLTVEN